MTLMNTVSLTCTWIQSQVDFSCQSVDGNIVLHFLVPFALLSFLAVSVIFVICIGARRDVEVQSP